ncbi:MAG: hypothetical protein E7521_05085 [Ruminococcaceae bacterium]|nr:hypothetical protein [Oscillospiraceae bacterium]
MKISIKRISCFLLALLMVLTVVGCKEEKKKKPQKVVVRDKITVVPSNKDEDDSTNSDISNNDNDNTEDAVTRAKRDLLKKEKEEKVLSFDELHKETFYPEYESQNVDWAGPEGYVIVYSPSTDKHGATTNMRVLANKLAVFFKDNDNVDLPVYKDTDPALEGVTKMIIVGDTAYYKSNLKETEFAVNLKGDKLVFEGGHFVMAEKAVDWFITIKREKGKVATLKGTQDNFTSTKTVNGMDLVYVWGDEFDGIEHVDKTKWQVAGHMATNPDLAFIDNEEVCGVENGRLRLSGIRYLPEDTDQYAHATHGSYDTAHTMAYRNGYIEIHAKLAYTQGSLPPLWLMSNPEESSAIPREQFTAPWTCEVDIFETFSNGNRWDVSFHKYYKSYDVVYDGVRYSNGITYQQYDENGNLANRILFNGEEIYSLAGIDKYNKINIREDGDRYQTWGTITSWRDHYDSIEESKQQYVFTGEALEKLNDTYHTYGYLHTAEGYKVYLDGECWLERDWDTAYDGVDGFDCNNNNGWGYELYYYLIMNQFIYTPGTSLGQWAVIEDNRTLPISSWIDHVRLYQLPDQIDVCTPAYNE